MNCFDDFLFFVSKKLSRKSSKQFEIVEGIPTSGNPGTMLVGNMHSAILSSHEFKNSTNLIHIYVIYKIHNFSSFIFKKKNIFFTFYEGKHSKIRYHNTTNALKFKSKFFFHQCKRPFLENSEFKIGLIFSSFLIVYHNKKNVLIHLKLWSEDYFEQQIPNQNCFWFCLGTNLKFFFPLLWS